MNAAALLAHYDRIADAPDAVERLRRLVLDLAVRGKLVQQNPKDEPPKLALTAARIWLAQEAQKTGRVRWKPSEEIAADEAIPSMPPGWVLARVNDTGLYINGLAFKPSDWKAEGLPIIRIQNLTDASKEFNYAQGEFPDEVVVRDGDILVSWSATLDAFKWTRGRGVLNQHIFRVIPAPALTTDAYLLLLLRNAIREMAGSEHAHGLVMTHINRGPFTAHLVQVPPIAEQHRIVAKVDELMSLCGQLEAARLQREATRDRLAAASLARLNTPDPETVQADARFAIGTALPAITTRPDQIKQLRQTILNLATRGVLLPQLSEDQPAAELMNVIAAAREVLVIRKAIKRSKPLPKVSPEEFDHKLPKGWTWCRLGDAYDVRDGTHDTPKYVESGIPLVTSKNLSTGVLSFSDVKLISDEDHEKISARSRVDRDDILLAMIGSIGNPVVVDTDRPFSIKNVALFKYFDRGNSCPAFLKLFLSDASNRMKALATGGLQPFVSLGFLRAYPIALPPLAEQHRIVAKVNELMTLCDQLEISLTRSGNTRSRLLNALLHEALSPGVRELKAA